MLVEHREYSCYAHKIKQDGDKSNDKNVASLSLIVTEMTVLHCTVLYPLLFRLGAEGAHIDCGYGVTVELASERRPENVAGGGQAIGRAGEGGGQ